MNLTQGALDAAEALMTSVRPRLLRMAAYYAYTCQEDPDDLLQEGWAGVLAALPNLDIRIGDPQQYLLRYARWRMLDAVRRAFAQRHVLLEHDDLERLLTTDETDEVLEQVTVAAFLQQLTPVQQGVVRCLLRGFTWREAGDVLGCSSANIAYHVRQIKDKYTRWRQNTHGSLANAALLTIEEVEACSGSASERRYMAMKIDRCAPEAGRR